MKKNAIDLPWFNSDFRNIIFLEPWLILANDSKNTIRSKGAENIWKHCQNINGDLKSSCTFNCFNVLLQSSSMPVAELCSAHFCFMYSCTLGLLLCCRGKVCMQNKGCFWYVHYSLVLDFASRTIKRRSC